MKKLLYFSPIFAVTTLAAFFWFSSQQIQLLQKADEMLTAWQFESSFQSGVAKLIDLKNLSEETKTGLIREFNSIWLKRKMSEKLAAKFTAQQLEESIKKREELSSLLRLSQSDARAGSSQSINREARCKSIREQQQSFWQSVEQSQRILNLTHALLPLFEESVRSLLPSEQAKQFPEPSPARQRQILESRTCLFAVTLETMDKAQLSKIEAITRSPEMLKIQATIAEDFKGLLLSAQNKIRKSI